MTELQNSSIASALTRRRLHFIGIGGSGMAPLAEIAFRLGFQVSGSDSSPSRSVQILQELGIPVVIGHSSENLKTEEKPTVIYSSAIKASNSEFQKAQSQHFPLMHRSDLLHHFLSLKPNSITVAGTNGKSTTSAMIAYCLHQLAKAPLSIIGAQLKDFESLSLCGEGDYSLAEADESDGTFLKYRPSVGVLTSIDLDHMDYYRDHEHIFETFKHYIKNIHNNGYAILNTDDPHCALIAKDLKKNKITYGFNPLADIQGDDCISKDGETYFSVKFFGKNYKSRIKTIGKHNVENALAAIATGQALGFQIGETVDALGNFSGVKRRLELIYKSSELAIYDDYAHNPTKIKSVVNAVRTSYLRSNLIVIFQPHRYSRIKTLYNNFVGSFSNASCVIVLPTYASGEEDESPIAPERLVADIENNSGIPCYYASTFEKAEEKVTQILKQESIILTLGAGDVWHLAFKLKERLG